jgi:hypothetical protein
MKDPEGARTVVDVGFLSPVARSVIEGFVYLQKRSSQRAIFELTSNGSQRPDVELFDRFADLQQRASQDGAAARIYLRGFEPFVLAAAADAVIDRPLRPSVLEAAVSQFQSRIHSNRSSATRAQLAFDAGVQLNPDQLLGWLNTHRSADSFVLSAGADRSWWCKPALREVHGAALESSIRSFELCAAAETARTAAGKALDYGQWVYWIARCSSGEALLDHADDHLFRVERGALSAADSREFAKLAALLMRPVSVRRAAELARVPETDVRRFLNANQVLGRLRAMPAEASPDAGAQGSAVLASDRIDVHLAAPDAASEPAPAASLSRRADKPPPRNLFSRLLNRLRQGSGHVG